MRAGHGDGHRCAEDGVGAEVGLVGCAVEGDHRFVEFALVERVLALEQLGDTRVDGVDGLEHALAEIDLLVAVTQFAGFEFAGRGTRRDGGAGEKAIVEGDVDLDGRVAARIENLPADDLGDLDEFGCDDGFRFYCLFDFFRFLDFVGFCHDRAP
ncbi:MAG: hypothetical protein AW08_00958 [Candidatus Accumulibacter adjunctus]|uniref:Uncharacterized protein n=1 Tax=Candidatus Accumulibacter adjunctus TaxID=1454001 RepID=A0A011N198_9PROT|nr:MAG: hypothetical protein AW08_00958 [Candidatus Accumulibacter adjunctus]